MAQIQIVLTQESTQSSVRVEISLAGGQEAIVSDETREAAVRATGAACISSISSLAQQNPNSVLDDNERESLQLTTDGGEEEAGVVSARTFGEVFRRAADELQSVVEEYTDSVTDSEDPTEAIGSLLRVLDDVFDVTEEQRQGQFNSGRLMGALYLSYCLVVKYIKRQGYTKVMPFLQQLVPRLILYLFEIGFLSWLIKIGGWAVVRTATMTDPYISAAVSVFPRTTMAVGLVYIAWRVARYFMSQ